MTDRKRIFVASAAVLAVAGGLYLALADSNADSRPAAQPAIQPATPAVQPLAAAPPADAVAPPGLDASRPNDCLIEPSRVVRVNSGVEGVIEAIYVDRGDNVGKGQVVARLRADVDRASAAAAEARAANA
ncbi:MAG: biotin/lipoyl-binding protein, partial [Sphingopyxis granuli]